MTAMRQETTSEHIARDMREGRFPERSDPQMVADHTETMPERIWVADHNHPDGTREYIRADLAAIQPAQVRVKPLTDLVEEFTTAVWHLMDNSETSGPIDDPAITVWKPDFDEVSKPLDQIEGLPSDSTEHMGAGELLSANILAALEPQPGPRDEVIARLTQRLETAHNAVRSIERDEETARDMLSDRDEVIKGLVDAADTVLHDIADLAANSEGVAGLHMNGSVAEWESLLDGGAFGTWLASVEHLRAALAAAKAVQHG